ncbi:TPA: erythromycin resistance leader peptide [Staphylococcus aureus]
MFVINKVSYQPNQN